MPDTTAPTLTGLVFPATIDLSKGNVGVTFTASATDDESGVASVVIDIPNLFVVNQYGLVEATDKVTIGGTALETFEDGSASATLTISKYKWHFEELPITVTVTDVAGNARTYSSEELAGLGFPNTLVTSGAIEDTTEPVLTSLSLPAVDLTNGPSDLIVTATASDGDGVGISTVTVYLDKSVLISDDIGWVFGTNTFYADPEPDGTLTGARTLAPWIDSGVYSIYGVSISDRMGNGHFFTSSELAALNLPTSITITGLGKDISPPVLQSFGPGTVDLGGMTKSVDFSLGPIDAGVGILDGQVILDKPVIVYENGAYIKTSSINFSLSTDSFDDGVSVRSLVISPYSDPGPYTVTKVVLTDRLHSNIAIYDTQALAALPGGTPSFTLTGTLPDNPPSLVSLGIPSNVDFAGEDKAIKLTAQVDDAETGASWVKMYFDKPLLVDGGTKVSSWGFNLNDYNTSLFLSKYNKPTTVTIIKVVVWDSVGNERVYEAEDLALLPGLQTTIQLTGGLDEPPEASWYTPIVAEDQSAAGNLLGSITDRNGDPVSLVGLNGQSLGTPVAGTYGTITLLADGSYTYAADRAAQLGPGDSVLDAFTVMVSDGLNQVPLTFTVRVWGDGSIEGTAGNDTLLGTSSDDYIVGFAGDDFLDGRESYDSLVGGAGNDTYVVDWEDDSVSEEPGEGRDTILVRGHEFILEGSSSVEFLLVDRAGGTSVKGNDPGQTIIGNVGADVLLGGGGSDVVRGGAQNDQLKGEAGNDKLYGDRGSDWLFGGLGRDVLTGGTGRDGFVFDEPARRANRDTITDFSPRDDTIWLEFDIFHAMPRFGRLPTDAFLVGRAARDAEDRIIYDRKTGFLFYDPDGTGSAVKTEIAKLAKGLKMTAADIYVA